MDFENFVSVKGWKAYGNKLGEFKVIKVEDLSISPKETVSEDFIENSEENASGKPSKSEVPKAISKESKKEKTKEDPKPNEKPKPKKPIIKDNKLNFGDTIEFDVE